MKYRANYLIAMIVLLMPFGALAGTLDSVFEKADRSTNKTETKVEGTVHRDIGAAESSLRSKVEEGDAKAAATNARARSQDSAKSNCGKSGNCYRVEKTNSSHVIVRCLAGSKTGESEWIPSTKDGYACNAATLRCEKSLEKAALSACLLN